MDDDFTQRLRKAFDDASMAGIARRLGLPHATVRNYFNGRLPAPDVLIKIASVTNVSLNWLLMGTGSMFADDSRREDLGRLIERRIDEIIEEKLALRGIPEGEKVQDLGDVDQEPEFDLYGSLARHGDPHEVMGEWFAHEGRTYPKGFGVVFFQGWESFTEEERIEAVRDAKRVLDRTLRSAKK